MHCHRKNMVALPMSEGRGDGGKQKERGSSFSGPG